ncbi:MAG: hypothetical protein JXM73_09215 [Anaerolineae bacterium]|nr:hypothetical protein [Anaerolineae bacterium]
MTDQQRIAQLEEQIAELKARLPKHSPSPIMLIQLDELEDELADLRHRLGGAQTSAPGGGGATSTGGATGRV